MDTKIKKNKPGWIYRKLASSEKNIYKNNWNIEIKEHIAENGPSGFKSKHLNFSFGIY